MSGQDETRRDESQQPDDHDEDMNTDASFDDETDVPVPGSSEPAAPPRHTDLHPGDGLIDELPEGDGERPRDAEQSPDETGVPDSDPGTAERDSAPNPR